MEDSLAPREQNMDIRYFYVTDQVQNKTLMVKYCPMEEMIADYFTKPLQGSLFIRLHNYIMGAEYDDGDQQTPRSMWNDEEDEHSEENEHLEAKQAEKKNDRDWEQGKQTEDEEWGMNSDANRRRANQKRGIRLGITTLTKQEQKKEKTKKEQEKTNILGSTFRNSKY